MLKAKFSMASIDAAIEAAEYQLAPAGVSDLVTAIDKLLTFARTFSITTDREGLAEIWRDGCKGMPRRALAEGVPEVLGKSRDTFRLPMPGAVWDIVRENIAKWEAEVGALREIRKRMQMPNVPQLVSPETFDDGDRELSPATQAAMAESLRVLAAAAPLKRMPRR